ncbi:receptor 45 [Desmophyllum pertusum]|uniref:Receptor 45 n=1 Tax=Desmophyllum pertusum TaxID=174260 RepID=A0A9X0D7X4_9CNID|nr:receptor 45 [Desmophyllum pertusum]
MSDDAPADRDEEMEAFDISPMALSFEAAGIIGMCSTIIIGNGLLTVLSFRKPSQSYTGNITLLYVAVTDMFTAIITMPLMVASLLELKWKYGDLLCKTTGVLTALFLCTSLLILCLVSLHRCWLVFCSNEELESMARKQTMVFLVVVVLSVAIACLAFLVDWRSFQSNPTRLLCRLANSPNYIAYRMYYCVFSMLMPLLIIILLLNRKPQLAPGT